MGVGDALIPAGAWHSGRGMSGPLMPGPGTCCSPRGSSDEPTGNVPLPAPLAPEPTGLEPTGLEPTAFEPPAFEGGSVDGVLPGGPFRSGAGGSGTFRFTSACDASSIGLKSSPLPHAAAMLAPTIAPQRTRF